MNKLRLNQRRRKPNRLAYGCAWFGVFAVMVAVMSLVADGCRAQIAHGQETPIAIVDPWCEGICQQDYLPIVTR